MSGGHFDYRQYEFTTIADSIQAEIDKNGKRKTNEELKECSWHGADWYNEHPEDLYHYKYPDEIIEKMCIAVNVIREAAVYAQRIDWLLSGDDGEENFLLRLKEDLEKLK